MPYERSQMLYNDGTYYKWKAVADHDNPYYTKGLDYTELNRTEGYEILYFLNHIMTKKFKNPSTAGFQKMEKMIKYHVPANIKSHLGVENWIVANWNKI